MNKIKKFLSNEIKTRKAELSIYEYLSWWLVRALLAGALINLIVNHPGNMNILMVSLNILASFAVPLVRIIFSPIRFIRKMPFRTQTILNIIIFFGSFFGQGLDFYAKHPGWDKFLHFLAGGVVVFIGNELIKMFIRKNDRVSPLLRSVASSGVSSVVIIAWELFEFIVDFYWPGSANQAYDVIPNPDMIFYKIFGFGAQNEGQAAVIDTDIDMLYALFANALATIALAFILRRAERKKQLKEKQAVPV